MRSEAEAASQRIDTGETDAPLSIEMIHSNYGLSYGYTCAALLLMLFSCSCFVMLGLWALFLFLDIIHLVMEFWSVFSWSVYNSHFVPISHSPPYPAMHAMHSAGVLQQIPFPDSQLALFTVSFLSHCRLHPPFQLQSFDILSSCISFSSC